MYFYRGDEGYLGTYDLDSFSISRRIQRPWAIARTHPQVDLLPNRWSKDPFAEMHPRVPEWIPHFVAAEVQKNN